MDIKNNLHYISLLIFSLFGLLANNLKGLPVIVLFVSSFIIYLKGTSMKYPIKKVSQMSILYLILLISLLYTRNFESIDKYLTTRLSLLIVPISMGLLYSTNEILSHKFLLNYTKILLFVTTFYSLWILFFFFQLGVFSNNMSKYDAIAYITNEMWLISQHPIYASIFIAITLLLIVYFWLTLKKRIFIFYTLPFVIINFATLFILERKGVLLSLLFGLFFLLLSFVKRNKQRSFLLSFGVIFFLSSFFLMMSSNRFKELYSFQNFNEKLEFNLTSLRFGIYNCAIRKIREAPIFGYGLGDVQVELDKCYHQNAPILTEITYNSHNQYLSYFLSSGIFGFLLLFFVMLKSIIDSIRNKNVLLLSISVFFAVCMLFENILERQSGVIVFSFYMCLFSFYNFSKPKKFEVISE